LGGLKETILLAKNRIGLTEDDAVMLKVFPGVERAEFDFKLETASVILDELEKLDPKLNTRLLLDRIAVLNSEPALYLMEEFITIK
ncbi:MAG: hypothetical protein KAK01_08170, partial [Candidatus Marinimicrobia bacterium]|nr:hypothetical protein [Candidatus Neomarinimicrobiota bacterium]